MVLITERRFDGIFPKEQERDIRLYNFLEEIAQEIKDDPLRQTLGCRSKDAVSQEWKHTTPGNVAKWKKKVDRGDAVECQWITEDFTNTFTITPTGMIGSKLASIKGDPAMVNEFQQTAVFSEYGVQWDTGIADNGDFITLNTKLYIRGEMYSPEDGVKALERWRDITIGETVRRVQDVVKRIE